MTTILIQPERLRCFTDHAGDAVTDVTHPLGAATEVAAGWHPNAGFPSPTMVLDDVADVLQRLLRLLAVADMVADEAQRLDRDSAQLRLVPIVVRLMRPSSRSADLAWALAALQDPEHVTSLWGLLTPDQQADLVHHHPDVVGHLDGVDLASRDAANRTRIGWARAELLQRIRALEDDATRLADIDDAVGAVSADAARSRIARLASRLGQLDRILDADQVIRWDPSGDGRAVVAWGDPSSASHVATFVPGMSNSMATFDRVMHDSQILHGELQAQGVQASTADAPAGAAGPTTVATVAWLGYDAPSGLGWGVGQAATDHVARAQSHTLASWTRSLRLANPTMVHIVVAHSYGSVLAGQALAAGRNCKRPHAPSQHPTGPRTSLGIDRLIVLGSPGLGTGVGHPRDLGMEPGQVLTVTNPHDVVPHLPVLGPDPAGFEDVVNLPVGAGNRDHSDYLVADTLGLTNISRAVLGLAPLPQSHW